jgi:hypothetical protein
MLGITQRSLLVKYNVAGVAVHANWIGHFSDILLRSLVHNNINARTAIKEEPVGR